MSKQESKGLCTICLERPAKVVAASCGHLVCCVNCRRRLVHETRVAGKECADTAFQRRNLTAKQLERTKVPCPICRSEGPLALEKRFVGLVYNSAFPDIEVAMDGLRSMVENLKEDEVKPEKVEKEDGEEESEYAGTDEDDFGNAEDKLEVPKDVAKEEALLGQLYKLWECVTTSLMNDVGMDAFLGSSVYIYMQTPTFLKKIRYTKDRKDIAKRRKAELVICPGVRLDGIRSEYKSNDTVTVTVREVEQYENDYGELVSNMLVELKFIRDNLQQTYSKTDVCMQMVATIERLLVRYRERHEQRDVDLQYLVRHGFPRKNQDELKTNLPLTMPMPCGMTTFMIDGAQMYHTGLFQTIWIFLQSVIWYVLGIIQICPCFWWLKYIRGKGPGQRLVVNGKSLL